MTEKYDELLDILQEDMKFLINSNIRLKILYSLYESPCTMKEITEVNDLSYSSVSGNINEMKKRGLIKTINNKIYLENKTIINSINLYYLNSDINQLLNGYKYLNNHKILFNDLKYFLQLNSFHDFHLVKSTPEDVDKVLNIIKKYLSGSKFTKILNLFLIPNYECVLFNLLKNNVNVEWLVQKDIVNIIENSVENFELEDLRENFKINGLNFPVSMVLIVSDKGVALSFYKKDGSIDSNSVLISNDEKNIKWGIRVFEEYKNINETRSFKYGVD